MIGYYMVHGGTHPVGKHSYMNEYTVPRISYDFQAPVGEFGQINPSYSCLRLLHSFLKDFGPLLAPMTVALPEDAAAITPDDTTSLRWVVRHQDGAGFIFMSNYQDHIEMRPIPDIQFTLQTAAGTLTIPHARPFTLEPNVSAILPFGLSLGDVKLRYATTQLLSHIGQDYFFFAPRGIASHYAFETASYGALDVRGGEIDEINGATCVSVTPGLNSFITLTATSGQTIRIFTLTREQAEHASKQHVWGQDRLLISESAVTVDGETCTLYSLGQEAIDLLVYPPVTGHLAVASVVLTESAAGCFTRYSGSIPKKTLHFQQEMLEPGRVRLQFPPDLLDGLHNVILRIDYLGDLGSAFIDGQLVHDNYYNGLPWDIGLRHFDQQLAGKDLLLLITPVEQHAGAQRYIPTGMTFRPETDGEMLAAIHQIAALPEYKIPIEHRAASEG